jgi:hypothetical protein
MAHCSSIVPEGVVQTLGQEWAWAPLQTRRPAPQVVGTVGGGTPSLAVRQSLSMAGTADVVWVALHTVGVNHAQCCCRQHRRRVHAPRAEGGMPGTFHSTVMVDLHPRPQNHVFHRPSRL